MRLERSLPPRLAPALIILLCWLVPTSTGCEKSEESRVSEQDIETARSLAESACASDLGSGCNTLGTILVQGAGQTEKDYAGAREAFAKACQLDDGEGCKNLALLFARGLGVDEDPMRSRQLYRRSCDLGFEPSCLVLEKMKQMDRDDARSSLKRARPACEAGDQAACARLGELLFFGHAGEPDVDRAVDLLDTSCGAGHSRACRVLSTGFYAGEALPRDLERARTFAERGCALDEFEACNILGLLHLSEHGPQRDIQRARDVLRRACDAENPRACSNLARALLMDNDDLETHLSEARDALRFACNHGLAESCARLADLLEGTSSDDSNDDPTGEIRQRACDLGHQPSCRELGNEQE